MRLVLFLLLVFASVLSKTAESNEQEEAKLKVNLPKVFDFHQFKLLFHKHYGSLLDELARQRIYLAVALRAFISACKYVHNQSTTYLSINEHSDKTLNERRKHLIPLEYFDLDLGQSKERNDYSQVANLEDVEVALSNTNFKEKVDQLILPAIKDEKRSSVNYKKRVQSNNPLYEQAELSSSSSGNRKEDEKIMPMLERNPLNLILSLPGAKFVKSIMDSTKMAKRVDTDKPDEIYVDLRLNKCLDEPRQQGDCNSCYAFAVIGLFEYLYCRENGRRVSFSEQFMVDCGFRAELNGCQGGKAGFSLKFVHQFGLHLRQDYPYLGTEQQCPYEPTEKASHMAYLLVHETQIVRLNEDDEFEKELASGRPLVFCLIVSTDFLDYGGGVDQPESICAPQLQEKGLGGHLMLMVGHGLERGEEYYLFRNSYGPNWGLGGHYKLGKRAIRVCACQKRLTTFTTSPATQFYAKHSPEPKPQPKSREQEYREFLQANKLD